LGKRVQAAVRRHTLLDIAERAQLPFGVVAAAARLLRDSGLLVEDRGAG
jgi:hypothetical protein